MWDISRLFLYHPSELQAGPALKVLRDYAEHGPDAIASQATWAGKGLTMPVARFIRRTAEVAEACGNVEAAIWVFKTFEKEFLMVKPMGLAHAKGQMYRLDGPPTPLQQRLFTAATRTGGLREKLRTETVQVIPKSEKVKLSPAKHAQRFQALLAQTGVRS